MSDVFENETNDLIDNAAADLINAFAKEQADEIRSEAQNSINTENSALQQNISTLNANTQAQRALNEAKKETVTIQELIANAEKKAPKGNAFVKTVNDSRVETNSKMKSDFDSAEKLINELESSLDGVGSLDNDDHKVKILENSLREIVDLVSIFDDIDPSNMSGNKDYLKHIQKVVEDDLLEAMDKAPVVNNWKKAFSRGNILREQVDKGNNLFKDTTKYDSDLKKLENLVNTFLTKGLDLKNKASGDFSTFEDRKAYDTWSKKRNAIFGIPEEKITGEDGEEIILKESVPGLMDEFKRLSSIMNEAQSALQNENASMEEKALLSEKANISSNAYSESIKKMIDALDEVNEETKKTTEETKKETEEKKKRDYNSYKYALVRDKNQQEDFLKDMPANFSTTGNMRESFLKTIFNRSTGLRQQRGVTGFAANFGYNASGTALSIALGTLAKAATDAGKAVLEFGKESVVAYGELQSIKTNLGIVYSSQSQADQTFNEIAQYSVKSPFGVQTVSEYAVLLKQSGIYASDLMDTLKQIGDVAGGNQQKFANIANAFSQIEANGKATTRQLRQFATAGIPIYKELTKAYEQMNGKSVGIEQIRKLTEEGKVSAQMIEKAFSNMTGSGGTFENAVEIGAKTWKARQQNLADAKQLAQAAVGEAIINAGGSGRGDSVAEIILSMKEGFYSIVNGVVETHNIRKSVENIEKQNSIVKKLKDEYDLLKMLNADSETLNRKREQIKVAASYQPPEQQRAAAMDLYNLYKEDLKKEVLSDIDYQRLLATEKRFENMTSGRFGKLTKGDDGSYVYKTSGMPSDIYTEEQMTSYANAGTKLAKSIRESAYKDIMNKISPVLGDINIALAEGELSKGYDVLDKVINKKQDTIYTAYQRGEQSYSQSTKGKEEERKKEIKTQKDAQDAFDKNIKVLDENGRFLDTFKGTIDDMVSVIQSGIIIPLEKISFTPENLANDYTYNMNSNDTEERKKRREKFNYQIDNWNSSINAMLSDVNVPEFVSNILTEFQSTLFDTVEVNGRTFTKKADNNKYHIEKIATAFNDAINTLESTGNGKYAEMLRFGSSINTLTGRPKDLNAGNEAFVPLWQRILNQNLGTDLTLFKKGAITNGRQAVDLFSKQSDKETIKGIYRSLLNSKSLDFASSFITASDKRYTLNNSEDGTKYINWEKTYKSITDFALSVDSAAEVTNAYAQSLDTEVSALKDFLSSSFTTMEDPENIFNPEYQEYIGEFANTIKALDVNVYDNLVEEIETTEGTFLKFRENSVDAANTLLKEKEGVLAFTEAIGTAKSAIEDLAKDIANAQIEMNVYTGTYSGRIGNLVKKDQISAMQYFNSLLSTPNMKKILEDNNLTSESILETYSKGGKIATKKVGLSKDEETALKDKRASNEALLEDIKNRKKEKEEEFTKQKTDFDALYPKYFAEVKNLLISNSQNVPDNTLAEWFELGHQKNGKEVDSRAFREYQQKKLDYKNVENEYKATMDAFEQRTKDTINANDEIDKKLKEKAEDSSAEFEKLFNNMNTYIDFLEKQGDLLKRVEYTSVVTGLWNKDASDNVTPGQNSYMPIKNIISSMFNFGYDIYGDNTAREQRYISRNFKGNETLQFDKVMDKVFNTEAILNAQKEYEQAILNKESEESISEKSKNVNIELDNYKNNVATMLNNSSGIHSERLDSARDILMRNATVDENGIVTGGLFDKNAVKEFVLALEESEAVIEKMQSTFDSLGKTIKDAFKGSLLDGFNNSMNQIGEDIYNVAKGTYDAEEAGDAYAKVWKNVAKNMLDSMGPAMTQAGFELIAYGARSNSKATIMSGIGLVAAGGVAGILGGILGASEEDDKDKNDDETSRLEKLKDLLADIIDQAKTDADYYQKHYLHQNAISANREISVNDAIITPSGNVISTHPDDYLIATKTPGSLSSRSSSPSVTVKFIDQSTGAKVEVKDTKQRTDENGNIEIEAMVVAVVNQAMADGKLDSGFDSRDARLNGRSVIY